MPDASPNQAMRWRLVTYNAASLLETPRIEQEEMSALTEQQARALLRTLKGVRLEALYRVALSLGLRRGEVLGLRWEDIDFEAATLRVAQTLQRTRTKGLITSTHKTKSSLRRVSIPRVLLAALKNHKEQWNFCWPVVARPFLRKLTEPHFRQVIAILRACFHVSRKLC